MSVLFCADPIAPKARIILLKEAFNVKFDNMLQPIKYKIRICACGDLVHSPNMTFAPVANMQTILVFCILAWNLDFTSDRPMFQPRFSSPLREITDISKSLTAILKNNKSISSAKLSAQFFGRSTHRVHGIHTYTRPCYSTVTNSIASCLVHTTRRTS